MRAHAFVPSPVDIAPTRREMGLSRAKFVRCTDFSPAFRDWEQYRRNPDPAARTPLTAFDREP